MTQKRAIIQHIDYFGSITPMEAYEYGITKLATRISELRREDGIEFKVEMVKGKNRYGKPIRFARYSYPDKNGV